MTIVEKQAILTKKNERTKPSLTVEEITNLNAYVGQQIASLLPKPDELAEAMQGGFTKASN